MYRRLARLCTAVVLCACGHTATGSSGAEDAFDAANSETDAALDQSAGEVIGGDIQFSELASNDAVADVSDTLDVSDTVDVDVTTDMESDTNCACGDFVCSSQCGESAMNCADCGTCGDGLCTPGESPISCAKDCCGSCGDGTCKGALCGETALACAKDCNTACGNDVCDKGESAINCPKDCVWQVCGNGICEPTDGGPASCPQDCATTCGNCLCEKGEDWSSCPMDCGYCGDGTCSTCSLSGESVASCPADCTAACGNCDDGVSCTVDYCGTNGSCVHLANAATCSDGDPCTLDLCAASGCTHSADPGACNDGSPCTDDVCSAQTGCTHAFNSAPCSDGDNCTSNDHCAGGLCVGSGTCPDVVEDTSADIGESLDVSSDGAVDVGSDVSSCQCGDGTCVIACGETVSTCAADCLACGDGVCAPGESPMACFADCCGTCGDGLCKGYDCGESPQVCANDCGTGCGNGVCNKGESPSLCPMDCQVGACGNGVCEAMDGGPAKCPEDCGNACGNCVCDKGEDFVTCPVDCGWCGDGVCSPCSALDETIGSCANDCKSPTCVGGCDDGVACTDDSCAGDGICVHLPVAGNCSDNDPCTDDLCSEVTGCAHPFNAAPCSDGDSCTTGDSCWQGVCAGSGTCSDTVGGDSLEDADAGSSDDGGADGTPDVGSADGGDGLDDAGCSSLCGDGTCACGENGNTCAVDCLACGDGLCSPGEGPINCAVDCCGGCGDGVCKGYACGESPSVCPVDCGNACGNQVCNKGETPATCPQDCLHAVCGNGVCEPSDGGPAGCPLDCGTACGNCACDSGEDWVTCPVDCGWCGDGICSNCTQLNEKGGGCAKDCGSLCPDGCNDGVPCTTDACAGPWSCTHTPDSSLCSDGDVCSVDGCDKTTGCWHNSYNCDDSNLCTDDACNGSGACTHTVNNGPCEDGDACTLGDTCNGVLCTTVAKNCEDGSPCTTDACVAGGCVHGGSCNLDFVFPFSIDLPGGVTTFSFEGMAGQRIAFDGPNTFSLCGVSMAITGPGGTVSSGGCFNGYTFVDVATLSANGTYTLTATASGAETGSGTVYIHNVPADPVAALVANGPAESLATTVPTQNARFTFSAKTGDRVALLTAVDFWMCGMVLTVLDPTGKVIYGNGCAGGAAFTDTIVLPGDGTYTVLLDPGGTAVGKATATLYAVPPDLVAAIAMDAVPVKITTTTPGQNASLTFSAKSGDRVAILTTSDFWMCGMVLTLIDPTGAAVFSNGCSGGTAFSDTLVLPVDGTYSVRLDPGGTAVGNVTTTIYAVPPETTGILAADAVPVSIANTTPSQNMRLTFSAKEGDRVALVVTSNFWMCGMALTLIDPTGKASYSNGCSGDTMFTDTLVLNSDGTYTVVLDPGSTSVGNVTVTLITVSPDVIATIAADAVPVTVATTVLSQNMHLSFAGNAGDRASVAATSGFWMCGMVLTVLDPAGKAIYSNGCAGGATFTDTIVLTEDGDYTIVLDPGGTAIGSVAVTLYAVPPDATSPIALDGEPVTLDFTVPGQNAFVTLNATAGQRFFTYSDTAFGMCSIAESLRAPEGTTLWSNGCAGGSAVIDTVTVATSGAYTLLADPGWTGTGQVTLRMVSVPADVTGVLVQEGPMLEAKLESPGQNAQLSLDVTAGVGLNVLLQSTIQPCAVLTEILNPNGVIVASNGCGGGTSSLSLANPAVSGTYAVRIDPVGAWTTTTQVTVVGL